MPFPILSTLTFLPIIAAILILFIKLKKDSYYWAYGIIIFVVNLIISLRLFWLFDKNNPAFQLMEIYPIFGSSSIKYFAGIDGISLLMIVLTTLLTPICIAISFNSVTKRVKEYVIAFLLIEGFVIG